MRAGRRVQKGLKVQRELRMQKGRRVQQTRAAQEPVKLRRALPVALLLVLVLVCGTVFAYMFHRTEDKSTTFIPAQVSCEVQESFKDNAKSSITVQNTGNIDAYIRVRLVTYWVTGETDANGKPKVAAKEDPPELDFTPASGWIADSNNTDSDKTFYYQIPVGEKGSANDTTPELLSSSITLEMDSDGNRQVVDVFAEAIQAKPTTAVEEAWGVALSGTTITGEKTS